MTPWDGPALPLIALAWPLLLGALAALPGLRPRVLWLLPAAPLPALLLAVVGVAAPVVVPDLLLGAVLAPEPTGLLLFGMTAGLWLAAGIFAVGAMAGTPRPAVFAGFWCLTLAGNLGVFLAGDVVTFYVAFAAVSLAAYCLVVQDRSGKALRAGRFYLVLAVLGEVCLLLGLLIGATAAGSLAIPAVRTALAAAELGPLALGLLIVGFGLKAGLMPLHAWLPLAHSAAPTPASAVLSGAIVKAGIIGLILFLPPQAVGWGQGLVLLGLGGAFLGAGLGLAQRQPKAILAYSTVSQMSLAVALIGAAVAGDGAMAPAAAFALHHGLAKGALFLSVGVIAATGERWRGGVLGVTALVALSVAGAPLTGGALAKAAAKADLPPATDLAVTLTAVTTSLLLAWCLAVLRGKAAGEAAARPGPMLLLPWLGLSLAALLVPWLLWRQGSSQPLAYLWQPATLWAAVWPIALGLTLAALAAWRGWRVVRLPEGDVAVLLERAARWALARLDRLAAALAALLPRLLDAGRLLGPALEAAARGERAMLRWQTAGLGVLALALVILLLADPGAPSG